MAKASATTAPFPLIIQMHQVIQALTQSDDENRFVLDKLEGALLYIDYMNPNVDALTEALEKQPERFVKIPLLTLYEKKAIINEYTEFGRGDDDIRARMSEFLSNSSAPQNFWNAIKDNSTEVTSWSTYFKERMKVLCANFLRSCDVLFVFEEDLVNDFQVSVVGQYKENLFNTGKVPTAVKQLRTVIQNKAKEIASQEQKVAAKRRGRPPKAAKQANVQIELTLPFFLKLGPLRSFVYAPDVSQLVPILFPSTSERIDSSGSSLRGSKSDTVSSTIQQLSARLAHVQKQISVGTGVAASNSELSLSKIKIATKKVSSKKGLSMAERVKALEPEKAKESGSTKAKKVAHVKSKKANPKK